MAKTKAIHQDNEAHEMMRSMAEVFQLVAEEFADAAQLSELGVNNDTAMYVKEFVKSPLSVALEGLQGQENSVAQMIDTALVKPFLKKFRKDVLRIWRPFDYPHLYYMILLDPAKAIEGDLYEMKRKAKYYEFLDAYDRQEPRVAARFPINFEFVAEELAPGALSVEEIIKLRKKNETQKPGSGK